MENSEDKTPTTLESLIAMQLPFLDEFLAKTDVALRDRPFRATFEFIELSIREFKDTQGRRFWLCSPPSLNQLSPTESEDLRSAVTEVAALLRAINAAIMGIPNPDQTLSGSSCLLEPI